MNTRIDLYKMIKTLHGTNSRNLLRGIVSSHHGPTLAAEAVNNIRKNVPSADLAKMIEMLLGQTGPYPFSNTGQKYRALLKAHSLNEIPAEKEILFVIGHLNGWHQHVQAIINVFTALADLPNAKAHDAFEALQLIAQQWGASNWLAKKAAYVAGTHGNQNGFASHFAEYSKIVELQAYSVPHFTALESINLNLNYFSNMNHRVQSLSRYIENDFRQFLPLHNIAPVPINENDVSAFLRKAHSMSLVDEVSAIIKVLHLKEQWPTLAALALSEMHPALRITFEAFLEEKFDTTALYLDVPPLEADEAYYRRSFAFLEFSEPCNYRSFIDRVMVPRLLRGHFTQRSYAKDRPTPQLRDLTRALTGIRKPSDYKKHLHCGSLLRTLHFLTYMERQPNPRLEDHNKLKKILNSTIALNILMMESEIERLYDSANNDTRTIVSALALGLLKVQSHDDEVDFRFRLHLCNVVIDTFQGNIASFIEWLAVSAPEVARFLLYAIDQNTLQKMYWVVRSADQALVIRQRILRIIGKRLKIIDCYIEADKIESIRQISKLRKYFDDSRMYVDSYAMKKWLIENPSSYSQQYIQLINQSGEGSKAVAVTVEREKKDIGKYNKINISNDYILREVASSAFRQFCIDTNFGIESYLGRRIRHNTLEGVMRGGVETLLDKETYRHLSMHTEFANAYRAWILSYRRTIDALRESTLQFKSPRKPNGLFCADLDFTDEFTIGNINNLEYLSRASASNEIFYERVISFCWEQIQPQLMGAAKYVSVDVYNFVIGDMNAIFSPFNEDVHNKFKAELKSIVHDKFARLGSWFREPESGFVNVTTKDLGELVLMEAIDNESKPQQSIKWVGSAENDVLAGATVHRMYDCLSVLVRNAYEHGSCDNPIIVNVALLEKLRGSFARFIITVSSVFRSEEERVEKTERIIKSFAEDDIGEAMLREGFSGIKKLRFITEASEGKSTAFHTFCDSRCTVGFMITVELAQENHDANASSSY